MSIFRASDYSGKKEKKSHSIGTKKYAGRVKMPTGSKVSDRFKHCPRHCNQNSSGADRKKTYDPIKKICSNCGFTLNRPNNQ
jgi:transcription elongation factor Elf1